MRAEIEKKMEVLIDYLEEKFPKETNGKRGEAIVLVAMAKEALISIVKKTREEEGKKYECVYTLSEAEQLSGTKADTLKKRCQEGKISGAVKHGKTWFVPRSEIVKSNEKT